MTETTEGVLRTRAKRKGYRLCKSRRQIDVNNLGEYMLVDASHNSVVLGSRFDATLDEVAEFFSR